MTGLDLRALAWLTGALAIAGAASGCVVDPTLGIAGAAVNGASYVATGRSADSHGLSWLTGEDCDLARALSRAPVCRPVGSGDGTIGLAAADGEPERTALAAVYEQAALAPVLVGPAAATAYSKPVPPRLYVVAASYDRRAEATAAAYALGDLPAAVARTEIAGAVRHRVVVGPLEPRLEAVLGPRLAAAGAEHWFPVALCPPALTPPPCLGPAAERPVSAAARLAAAAGR